MEHTLNRRTTTILTYINQGRRPVAFPAFPCPSVPPPGPYGPVLRGPSGRGGPSGGRAPAPMGSGASRRGPCGGMQGPPRNPPCPPGPVPLRLRARAGGAPRRTDGRIGRE